MPGPRPEMVNSAQTSNSHEITKVAAEALQHRALQGPREMAALAVDMKGKALLFKTINVHHAEIRSDFQRVPDDLTFAQAEEILNGQIVLAEKR